jgi:hypothetical protein
MEEVLWFITSSFQILLLHPLVGLAIVSIAYTWVLTYKEVREAKLLEWPQTIALLSVVATTMQVPLPFVMAFIEPHDPKLGWMGAPRKEAFLLLPEVLFFLVAMPCALIRKGAARWCLAFSSIVFLVFTGFIYLISGIRF